MNGKKWKWKVKDDLPIFYVCIGKLYQMGFCCAYKKTLKNIKKGVDFVFWKWYYLTQTKLTSITDFTNFLLPDPMGAEVSARTLANLAEQRLAIEVLYNTKVDIMKYQMTAYGAYLALTDYLSHATPQRVTKGWEEKRMFNITDGHQLVDRAQEYFASIK